MKTWFWTSHTQTAKELFCNHLIPSPCKRKTIWRQWKYTDFSESTLISMRSKMMRKLKWKKNGSNGQKVNNCSFILCRNGRGKKPACSVVSPHPDSMGVRNTNFLLPVAIPGFTGRETGGKEKAGIPFLGGRGSVISPKKFPFRFALHLQFFILSLPFPILISLSNVSAL